MNAIRHFFLITCLILPFNLEATEFIESFHSDIDIRQNGDLYVTETIVVHAEGKSIRRGIFRDFPTRYQDADGRLKGVGFNVLSVKRDGKTEPYHVKRRANGERVYIGDSNVFLEPGYYEYQLSYYSTRQLGFFEKFDELYWNVTGTGWSFEIDKASAKVVLPANAEELKLTGYTGPQGSTQQNLSHRRIARDQAYFETTTPLLRNEGLTIVATFSKGLVSEPDEAQKRAWFFQDHRSSIMVFGGATILVIYYLLIWWRVGRDPAAGVIIPRYQPPSGYSPASMRFIQNMGYDKTCFSAAVVNLAVKGAVDIKDNSGGFEINKTGPATTSLAAGESEVVTGLFSDGSNRIEIKQANHRQLSKAIGKHRKSLKGDYAKKNFSTNSWYLVPAVLFSVACIFFAVKSLELEELIVKTIFVTVFTAVPMIMLVAGIRGAMAGGFKGYIRTGINFSVTIAMVVFFLSSDFDYETFSRGVSWWTIFGILTLAALNFIFYHLLKAPTRAGRKLLDQIEGFKHYLNIAEDDEIALRNAPEFTTDIYETYLPYAIALELENKWTARLDRAIQKGTIESSYHHPRWYHSHSGSSRGFAKSLS
ncbi:MAG: DUF2207 domain-containing protein, partial [Pseudomonadota bacterium]